MPARHGREPLRPGGRQGQARRRCRIYAPVGSHETLLAYLVRRLLENGANSSFVNRIVDPAVSIASLVVDPVAVAAERRRRAARQHPAAGCHVARTTQFARRRSRRRCDACRTLRRTREGVRAARRGTDPRGVCRPRRRGNDRVRNPADRDDIVGTVIEATTDDVARAVAVAAGEAGRAWSATPADARAACLERAADLLEAGTRHVRGTRGARSRQDGGQCHLRSARGRRFPPLLRGAGARRARGARRRAHRPRGRHFAVELSAGDFHRAKSRRRSRPAIPSSRSRRNRRRSSPTRRFASCIARAFLARRCNSCPGAARPWVRRSSAIRVLRA